MKELLFFSLKSNDFLIAYIQKNEQLMALITEMDTRLINVSIQWFFFQFIINLYYIRN